MRALRYWIPPGARTTPIAGFCDECGVASRSIVRPSGMCEECERDAAPKYVLISLGGYLSLEASGAVDAYGRIVIAGQPLRLVALVDVKVPPGRYICADAKERKLTLRARDFFSSRKDSE